FASEEKSAGANWTELSALANASHFESGLNATGPATPSSCLRSLPSACQTRSEPFVETAARRLPSPLIVADAIGANIANARIGLPLESHSRIVESAPAVKNDLPSAVREN